MELSTIEKNTEAQDIQSDAYDQRVHSVLIVPEHALKKIDVDDFGYWSCTK